MTVTDLALLYVLQTALGVYFIRLLINQNRQGIQEKFTNIMAKLTAVQQAVSDLTDLSNEINDHVQVLDADTQQALSEMDGLVTLVTDLKAQIANGDTISESDLDPIVSAITGIRGSLSSNLTTLDAQASGLEAEKSKVATVLLPDGNIVTGEIVPTPAGQVVLQPGPGQAISAAPGAGVEITDVNEKTD